MALADTGKAIGAVTEMLKDHLVNRFSTIPGFNITVGRPESAANETAPKLNLFLYEALFDQSLKNITLDEGQPAPLWLVLKYLVTAFDNEKESDSIQAHEYLGEGIRALQELSFMFLTPNSPANAISAIYDSPEVLKLTFDETPSELLSKLMQGSEEKYRLSIAFQVRPVMIATGESPSYSLLVGVDYIASPPDLISEEGIKIPVIPSMGSAITQVSPAKFEVNSTITIFGSDLNLSGLGVRLGPVDLAVTAQQPDRLQCRVNGNIGGRVISAGSHPISVVRILSTNRRRSSNFLVGDLLPTLTSAVTDSLVLTPPTEPTRRVFGNIVMTGTLLGGHSDDIFVATYQDGRIVKLFDGSDRLTVTAEQTSLTLAIPEADAVLPGRYRIILRVNGQQAKNSPEVELIP